MATKGKEIAERWKASTAAEDEVTSDSAPTESPATSPEDQAVNDVGGSKFSPKKEGEAQAQSNFSTDSEEHKIYGQELGAIFKDNDVHPIFIFGSKGAGKTSILASLFKYAQTGQAQVSLSLRDDLFPSGNEFSRFHVKVVRDFYYKKIIAWIEGKAPVTTQEDVPFFIPVMLKLTTGEEVNFAFLEGKGEWYMPDHDAEIPFKPFQGFVRGVLEQYNNAATAIFVAPYATGSIQESSRSPDLRNSDLGLVGAIGEYLDYRAALLHRDKQLFLVSKWDVFCGGIAGDSFINPQDEELVGVCEERFEFSWARYQGMGGSARNQNKRFSAYSSGIIQDKEILRPAKEDMVYIDQYARKMWNWLYQNHTGKSLYPDMDPKSENFLDRLLRIIRG